MLAIVFRDRELRGRFLGMSRHESWVYRFIERNASVECGVYSVWLCEEGMSVISVVGVDGCCVLVDFLEYYQEAAAVWFLAGLMKRSEDLVWVVGVSVRHDDDWRVG